MVEWVVEGLWDRMVLHGCAILCTTGACPLCVTVVCVCLSWCGNASVGLGLSLRTREHVVV